VISLKPIGVFRCDSHHPYEARRQASVDTSNSLGVIHLNAGHDFEQALRDLEGFERIWIVYQFHHNADWKPMVMPPRGPRTKRGVFATRAPYRPNPIGLSCVRLKRVEGLCLTVEGHDLLSETPILDIKPYLPYSDAFADSRVGWLENLESERWQILFAPEALKQIHWLEQNGVSQLRGFLQGQLEFDPLDDKRKRVQSSSADNSHILSYRTWRIVFFAETTKRIIQVESVRSGYSSDDRLVLEDTYNDKALHARFENIFSK
jgi:tRNA-Thr(GGU) m(6)t(6)A37 methyltransferase TsaA